MGAYILGMGDFMTINKHSFLDSFKLNGVLLFCTFILTTGIAKSAEPQFITLGSGGVTGVYYPASGAICRMVNKHRKQHGLRCAVESTQGSTYNLNMIRNKQLDFVVAQSDSQHYAYHGEDAFTETGANQNLRSVFSLHAEPFTVVARADANIKSFEDLAGKRINIGNPGSGQRAIMEKLMQAYGWTNGSFEVASELSSAEQSRALCDNKIDAFVFSVGHPAGSLKEAANSCNVIMVPVTGDTIDKLVNDHHFFAKTVVPGGVYRGTKHDVPTFGVNAAVMTSINTDKRTVYLLVKSVFENLAAIKKTHPAFGDLKKNSMANSSLDIPLHEGAIQYFQEVDL